MREYCKCWHTMRKIAYYQVHLVTSKQAKCCETVRFHLKTFPISMPNSDYMSQGISSRIIESIKELLSVSMKR